MGVLQTPKLVPTPSPCNAYKRQLVIMVVYRTAATQLTDPFTGTCSSSCLLSCPLLSFPRLCSLFRSPLAAFLSSSLLTSLLLSPPLHSSIHLSPPHILSLLSFFPLLSSPRLSSPLYKSCRPYNAHFCPLLLCGWSMLHKATVAVQRESISDVQVDLSGMSVYRV